MGLPYEDLLSSFQICYFALWRSHAGAARDQAHRPSRGRDRIRAAVASLAFAEIALAFAAESVALLSIAPACAVPGWWYPAGALLIWFRRLGPSGSPWGRTALRSPTRIEPGVHTRWIREQPRLAARARTPALCRALVGSSGACLCWWGWVRARCDRRLRSDPVRSWLLVALGGCVSFLVSDRGDSAPRRPPFASR